MGRYKCVTGGVVVDGKPYKAGKIYSFDRNPDPRHFVPVYPKKSNKRK